MFTVLDALSDAGVAMGLPRKTALEMAVETMRGSALMLEQNQKEAPVQIAGPELPLQFTVTEQGVRFKIDMFTGYSQGIFLDQRDHRRQVKMCIRDRAYACRA